MCDHHGRQRTPAAAASAGREGPSPRVEALRHVFAPPANSAFSPHDLFLQPGNWSRPPLKIGDLFGCAAISSATIRTLHRRRGAGEVNRRARRLEPDIARF